MITFSCSQAAFQLNFCPATTLSGQKSSPRHSLIWCCLFAGLVRTGTRLRMAAVHLAVYLAIHGKYWNTTLQNFILVLMQPPMSIDPCWASRRDSSLLSGMELNHQLEFRFNVVWDCDKRSPDLVSRDTVYPPAAWEDWHYSLFILVLFFSFKPGACNALARLHARELCSAMLNLYKLQEATWKCSP